MAKHYRVFISHSWTHCKHLKKLQSLLSNRGYFGVEFQEQTPDHAVNSENTSYIKQRLKQKITDSDIVLAIAGIYATHSDWIGWELETAKALGIPIVGVIPRGQRKISSVVSLYAITHVRWNTESIVDAIRTYARRQELSA